MKKFTLLLFLLAFSLGFSQPSTVPASPTNAAVDVISIYGDSYTNVATNYDPNWGQSGHMQVNASYDPGTGQFLLAYFNFNYQGTELTTQDASQMEFLHLDIWTAANPGATDIQVSPINNGLGAVETLVSIAYTSGTWTSVDIPKSAFTGMIWDSVFQIKFGANGPGSTVPVDIYLDNIYFWKNPPTGPANDDVCNAEMLTVDAAPTTGDNTMATLQTFDPFASCYGDLALENTVWYTFVAPASGAVIVSTDFDTPNDDTQIALYTITNCLDLSTAIELACDEDGGFVGNGNGSIMEATGLTPGNTYYIQVDGYDAQIGEFQIQVTATAPGNDDCAGATAITLGTEFSGDTSLATDSGIGNASCSMSGGNQDVWYVFTAPVSTIVSLETTADFVVIYDACGGSEVACLSDGEQSPALMSGAQYWVRIYNSGFARIAGSFTATITEATLTTQDFNNGLGFSYHPNPVKNTLTLKAQQAITNVAVYNMLGQEVIKTEPNAVSNNVDMSNLQSGAYFVQVTVGNTVETVRVIKN